MSRIRIPHRAEADLDEIWLHVAESNPRAADRLIAKIVDKYQTLLRFPEMGSLCEELAPRLRSLAVGNYAIFYRPIENGIEIVRVVHAARDLPTLFRT
jgi:toxin ParE1/3/4